MSFRSYPSPASIGQVDFSDEFFNVTPPTVEPTLRVAMETSFPCPSEFFPSPTTC